MWQFSTLSIYLIYSGESPSLTFFKGGAKFFNFYGLPEARLNRDDSVYGHWTNRRTWFIKSISMFLFSAPDVHLRNLQKMWVDGLMHQSVWEQLMTKVTDEWREFILYVSHKTQTTTCPKSYRFIFYLSVNRLVKCQPSAVCP